jgi:hypothetical protein
MDFNYVAVLITYVCLIALASYFIPRLIDKLLSFLLQFKPAPNNDLPHRVQRSLKELSEDWRLISCSQRGDYWTAVFANGDREFEVTEDPPWRLTVIEVTGGARQRRRHPSGDPVLDQLIEIVFR